MRSKIRKPNQEIKLILSTRQRRQIQRALGYHFEATVINEGLLLHTTKQKYRLSDLIKQCDTSKLYEEDDDSELNAFLNATVFPAS